MHDKTLIVIAGPTAVGKTALAIEVAKHYQTEIISADSRQFYREMEIGTAKPSLYELQQVKHHFVGSHGITESFTVGDFEKEALGILHSLFIQHNVVLLVGGSGLYIKAVCEGFDEFPEVRPGVREEL
ncbi:MAG: miaA, partial [Daejeonella sp.]|nr:miaA [Daejeonella sp.]